MATASERQQIADSMVPEIIAASAPPTGQETLEAACAAALDEVASPGVQRLNTYIKRLTLTDIPDDRMRRAAIAWTKATQTLFKGAEDIIKIKAASANPPPPAPTPMPPDDPDDD